jgi:hypothetical protein
MDYLINFLMGVLIGALVKGPSANSAKLPVPIGSVGVVLCEGPLEDRYIVYSSSWA